MSRIYEIWHNIPLTTATLIVLNSLIHVAIFLFSIDASSLAIAPGNVLRGQIYRLITSNFVHGGIFHILMNMMSLHQIGSQLENFFGSLQLLYFTLWIAPLCNMIYLFLSIISRSNQSAVGFSAVLFCYAVLESFHSTESTRRLFFITVPAKLYPWVLLVLIQVMMPNVSFLGHLSGIAVGLLLVSSRLDCVLPSSDFFVSLEQSACISFVRKQPNYVPFVDRSVAASGASLASLYSGLAWFAGHIGNVISTIFYIFGVRLAPIHFPTWPMSTTRPSASFDSSSSANTRIGQEPNTTAAAASGYRRLSQDDPPNLHGGLVDVDIEESGDDTGAAANTSTTMTKIITL